MNDYGLHEDNKFASSWGSNISGLSYVIPEPSVGILVLVFGIGLLIIHKKQTKD